VTAEGRVKPSHAQTDPDLRTRRTGQKLAERHEVGVTLSAQPSPTFDQLVVKVAEVRDRPTERGQSEAGKNRQHLEKTSLRLWLRWGRLSHDRP